MKYSYRLEAGEDLSKLIPSICKMIDPADITRSGDKAGLGSVRRPPYDSRKKLVPMSNSLIMIPNG